MKYNTLKTIYKYMDEKTIVKILANMNKTDLLSILPDIKDDINWSYDYIYEVINDDNINEYIDYVDWNLISSTYKLSEEFIEKYADRVNWIKISSHYTKFDENFYRKHDDKINMTVLSEYKHDLSEEFIHDYRDKLYWEYISKYNYMSEEFMDNHYDYIKWNYLVSTNRVNDLSDDFITIHCDDFNKYGWMNITNNKKKISCNLLWKTIRYIDMESYCKRNDVDLSVLEYNTDLIKSKAWFNLWYYHKDDERFKTIFKQNKLSILWARLLDSFYNS